MLLHRPEIMKHHSCCPQLQCISDGCSLALMVLPPPPERTLRLSKIKMAVLGSHCHGPPSLCIPRSELCPPRSDENLADLTATIDRASRMPNTPLAGKGDVTIRPPQNIRHVARNIQCDLLRIREKCPSAWVETRKSGKRSVRW